MHFLNAPPFTDAVISLVKSVFDSKLAEKVSEFNRMHFLLALTFAISTFNSTKRQFPLYFRHLETAKSFPPSRIYQNIYMSTIIVICNDHYSVLEFCSLYFAKNI